MLSPTVGGTVQDVEEFACGSGRSAAAPAGDTLVEKSDIVSTIEFCRLSSTAPRPRCFGLPVLQTELCSWTNVRDAPQQRKVSEFLLDVSRIRRLTDWRFRDCNVLQLAWVLGGNDRLHWLALASPITAPRIEHSGAPALSSAPPLIHARGLWRAHRDSRLQAPLQNATIWLFTLLSEYLCVRLSVRHTRDLRVNGSRIEIHFIHYYGGILNCVKERHPLAIDSENSTNNPRHFGNSHRRSQDFRGGCQNRWPWMTLNERRIG